MRKKIKKEIKNLNMKKVILMRGLPGSGKSTYAKKLVADNPEMYKRINRDDLRMMFDNGFTSDKNEKFVKKVRDLLIMKALEEGKSVIVDDTNLSSTNETRIRQLVREFSKNNNDEQIEVEVKEMDTTVEECIKRDAARSKPVGEKVIKNMEKQFYRKELKYAEQDASLPKAILCDLDGTLCIMNGRNPFDAATCEKDLPNNPVLNVLKNYKKLGYTIILLSGRQDVHKPQTLNWLKNHEVEFDLLLMRRFKDMRKDSIIKREIFDKEIANKYFIEFCLDDRNQVVDMWRNDLGLPCFQVFYGDF
jgi:predicted kinase